MKTNKITFVFTGPESTAKSSLAELFSKEYNLPLVKEYAREYLMNIDRAYELEDVLLMAQGQLKQEKEFEDQSSVLDTDLSVFNIWLDVKYGHKEEWIDKQLKINQNKVYLLCYPDIEWEGDPLRETTNKEELADLFARYEDLLKDNEAKYFIIKGQGQERIENTRRVFEAQKL
jgi:nicotinamide riboside kinase